MTSGPAHRHLGDFGKTNLVSKEIRYSKTRNAVSIDLYKHQSLAETVVLEEALGDFFVLKSVLCADRLQHLLLAGLLHFTGYEELVENEVGFLEVEDDVQLAHAAEVSVQELHIAMYDFQTCQLVVAILDGAAEVERCVPLVHDFHVLVFEEGAHLRLSGENRGHQFARDLLLGLRNKRVVHFSEVQCVSTKSTGLPCPDKRSTIFVDAAFPAD